MDIIFEFFRFMGLWMLAGCGAFLVRLAMELS